MEFPPVIFDLDGTLLDTLADIADSANRVLASHGCPTYPVDAYRQFVGEGVTRLFERALPADQSGPEVVAECVSGFRAAYAEHWNVRTRPYDGVAELLDALSARGVMMAVLSNKPDRFTRRCVDEYLSRWRFEAVFGQREGVPAKPDPAGALEIARRLGAAADRFVYLGDSATDMRTARSAGMRAVGAAWGFRSVDELESAGAEVIIQRPIDFLAIVDPTCSV
jgi:phosphoglycolate phosphatase